MLINSVEEFGRFVTDWARPKGLLVAEAIPKQIMKLTTEVREFIMACQANDRAEIVDGLGDCFVVTAILCEQVNVRFSGIYANALTFRRNREPSEGRLSGEELLRGIGAFSEGMLKDDYRLCLQGLTVICIALQQYCAAKDVSPIFAMSESWQIISQRTGKTIDGVFVKDQP